MNNIAFTGFDDPTIGYKKRYGEKKWLSTKVNNADYNDYFIMTSLPERFLDAKHPEKLKLESFKTKRRQYLMLNGKLLDVNHANKDTVSKVVLILRRMKKEIQSVDFSCFVEDAFLDKLIVKKNHPVKETLRAAGNFFNGIGKGFMGFIFK